MTTRRRKKTKRVAVDQGDAHENDRKNEEGPLAKKYPTKISMTKTETLLPRTWAKSGRGAM